MARTFWAHIDPAVTADLSYTFEEINFTASRTETQRLRSAAYKLTEKPETLTDQKNLSSYCAKVKTNFKTTGLFSVKSAFV